MTEPAAVLVATRLQKTNEERQRAQNARRLLAPHYTKIFYDWELNWEEMRRHAGGHDATYRAVAEQYNPLILVEGRADEYFLSRGLFSMANWQLKLGVAPIVYRVDGFYPVRAVVKTRNDSWAENYATAWVSTERWF